MEQYVVTVEQCGTMWHSVAQCDTVWWNNMVGKWNSVVEQCGTIIMVGKWNSVVEQCEMVW